MISGKFSVSLSKYSGNIKVFLEKLFWSRTNKAKEHEVIFQHVSPFIHFGTHLFSISSCTQQNNNENNSSPMANWCSF